jgi:hypothetical protein
MPLGSEFIAVPCEHRNEPHELAANTLGLVYAELLRADIVAENPARFAHKN